MAHEAQANYVETVEYARQQVLEGYIFLDWFAIPQITARIQGVNEDQTKSDAALAVQSIPFYVEVSNIFLALVPEVKHLDTQKCCNYGSWLARGWCRAELWCHLLSNKPHAHAIVIFSPKEAQVMFSADWQAGASFFDFSPGMPIKLRGGLGPGTRFPKVSPRFHIKVPSKGPCSTRST